MHHAIGFENAVPVAKVASVCEVKSSFVSNIVKKSRRKGYFIGGCSKGIFLIDTHQDGAVALEYYNDMIEGLQVNQQKLKLLMTEQGWSTEY